LSFRGKQVLVTGGVGFIGSHLVDKLIEQDSNVTVFDDLSVGVLENLHYHMSNSRLQFVKGDVTDKQHVMQVMEQNFDVVFHLAAVVGVERYCKNPLRTIDVNFFGTRNIAETALKSDTKIVFISTSEVYGKNSEIPLRENSDRVLGASNIARWSYSSSKALCEHLLFALNQEYDLPVVILRPFNVYGPRQLPPLVIPSFVKRVVHGKPPIIYGSGRQTRAFTYVEDVVDGIIEATIHPDVEGEVFNIGSNYEITMCDLADLIIDLADQSDNLRPMFVSYTQHYGKSYEDIDRRVSDVSKIKKRLGWEAKTSLKDGLLKTIEYWRRKGNFH